MATDSTLHVTLDRPPQAFSLTIRSLLQRVQAGGVRVPPFQRPLRWRADDVVKLFDSLLRGYPVGSLLFWKRPADADPNNRVGGALLPVPAQSDAWWIVDGQQRVTALAAALLDVDHGKEVRWTVRFDPVRGEFLSGPVCPEDAGKVVPLSVLGDLRRLGRWLRDSSLDEATQNVIESVQQRILDYELSAYLMETEKPEALHGVFARLNSTGVRMRSDEVFQALLGQTRADRKTLDLGQLQQACDIDSFGQPPRGEILKAVLAMSGHDPTRRLEVLGEAAASKFVDESDAAETLVRVVEFLQASPDASEPGAGIPCYAFIPYPVVFVVLARWFHAFPSSSRDTRRALAHWLWRGAISAAHQRAAVSQFRQQVRLIKGEREEDELDGLLASMGEPVRVDWTLENFHARNARSRLELLALLSREPRDRSGPVSWRALVSSGERVAREIIPSAGWKELDKEDMRLAKSVANRVLLDASGTGLRAEFRRWSPERDADALASHLIDEEMWRSLRDKDSSAFLRRRAARVQAVVSEFLTSRAGLGAPRLRAVEHYQDTEPDLDDPPPGVADEGPPPPFPTTSP